jgi:pyroglutamyl-peptidase
MRLLIYGFGPYKQFKHNITERIIRRLPGRTGLKRIVFPVRFQRSQFIAAVKKYKPDTILGLGQSSKGRRLRIELRAVNKRRKDKIESARLIVQDGSKSLKTSLRLNSRRQARFSSSAGDYVCNYSMYIILDYIRRNRLSARFGFIHVPYRYNLSRATRFLHKILNEVTEMR